MIRRAVTASGVVLAAILLGGCGASITTSTSTLVSSVAAAPTTDPHASGALSRPTFSTESETSSADCTNADYENPAKNPTIILWEQWPNTPADAIEVGSMDKTTCEPSIESVEATLPTAPGYCTKLAWATDNPGYDVDMKPAAPLKEVIDTVGDC
ncbi:hypothetical protein [Gordonia sp. N1V]|uniref:hypothetical protein n=1 Tax=Gordonia sp. N1V TaxID=3034163 RepID=UPI0023E22AC9|nr:hypothetical protein [Gordonia sp. N1V]MDF3284652.1 hypothetical protein [Gordonia sp. N1V]